MVIAARVAHTVKRVHIRVHNQIHSAPLTAVLWLVCAETKYGWCKGL